MPEKSSIFDMIGPVMIGPSNSHTAGVIRIARAAIHILGEAPLSAIIAFYNSFARTYEGHGSDRAVVVGLLDFATDNTQLKDSLTFAAEARLQYTFRTIGNAFTLHPNTLKLELTGTTNQVTVVGESRGGGIISIVEMDGFACDFSANLHPLIVDVDDVKGSTAFIANVIAHDDCNLATMNVSRRAKHDLARHFIQEDTSLKPIILQYIHQLSWIKKLTYIPNIDL